MEKSGCSNDSWESLPWLTEVAWFCCLNRKLVADWPPVYIITFYFIMSNIYDVYLAKIDEYALVNTSVFASFFASSFAEEHLQRTTESLQVQPEHGNIDEPFVVDSGIACLLKDDNHLLSQPQKELVRSMLPLDADAKVPGWLRLHLYIGRIDEKFHMVHCTCCAYDYAHVLVTVLENYGRYRMDPEGTVKAVKRMPRMMERLLQHIPTETLAMVQYNHSTNYDWGSRVHFTTATVKQHNFPRSVVVVESCNQRIMVASAVLLLYTYMPHAFAFRQLCRIIRRADHQTLIEMSFIIDRMLLNYPKEVDVWSIKLFLMKTLFKHVHPKDPSIITNILTLLDRRCMDIEGLCLAVTKKGSMNGRIPWFLWNLYLFIRKRTLKRAGKHAEIRIQRTLDSYYIQMYTSLLLANEGYQGIFYLYLHIVRKDPIGMKQLRQLCKLGEPNASWEANLGILDNIANS